MVLEIDPTAAGYSAEDVFNRLLTGEPGIAAGRDAGPNTVAFSPDVGSDGADAALVTDRIQIRSFAIARSRLITRSIRSWRVITGGIMHETHTFSVEPTTIESFGIERDRGILASRGTNRSMGGVVDGPSARHRSRPDPADQLRFDRHAQPRDLRNHAE